MAARWKAQNPDLAYNTGRMSAEEYKAVTGKYPKGYTAPRSGGAAVRDPYGMGSLSDAQRSTQIRGLLESLNKCAVTRDSDQSPCREQCTFTTEH